MAGMQGASGPSNTANMANMGSTQAASGPSGPGRYACIHGHFYQPPRENPWLEDVEVQDGAAPYHDWNARITAECYEPNAFARILDSQGYISRISSNYERISFNFGPTLLAWLEHKTPRVYQAILRADQASLRRFSGHGSAMAQAYNHIILPLASRRDKRTQILWGLRDFKSRFGRQPEGMWLPETAVDLESLDLMAELGLSFTILAPHQAKAVRPLAEGVGTRSAGQASGEDFSGPYAVSAAGGGWLDVSGSRIDPTRPYLLKLPSGRTITLFFYDGPISRAVAFERLLNRGEDLEARLLSGLPGPGAQVRHAPLVHIATDGETYGHHHTYGEMALAYALEQLEQRGRRGDVTLTNYGEYLSRHAPTYEVQIFENTAWSCAHGVERWRSDCGCNSGGRPGWHQRWRAPLRAAFDFLRDSMAPLYEQLAASYLRDPWAARDEYVDVILERHSENRERSRTRFLRTHATRLLDASETTQVWRLLELQRNALLMYTSCGWFFDDVAGTETVQDILYAGRVLQLGRELSADVRAIEDRFLELLSAAPGNTPELPTGRAVYERAVKQARADLAQVAAHHAMSSLFAAPGSAPANAAVRVYCYSVTTEEHHLYQAGRLRLGIGRLHVASDITSEEQTVSYSVLHFGDHNVTAGVLPEGRPEICQRLQSELLPPFQRADLAELLRAFDRQFGPSTPPEKERPAGSHIYSLKHLFRDEQRLIVSSILDTTLRTVATAFQQIYQNYTPLMRFLADLDVPQPGALLSAAEYALNTSLRHALASPGTEHQHIAHLLEEATRTGVRLDYGQLRFALNAALDELLARVEQHPDNRRLLQELVTAVELAAAPPFELNLWRPQNAYAELIERVYPTLRASSRTSADAAECLRLFARLGERLHVRLPDL